MSRNVESLSKALSYLSKTDLDLAVRSQGVGSASAKDVLISMTAFDDVDFDRENEVVTVGAGQSWGEYYEKMDRIAPEYASKASPFSQHMKRGPDLASQPSLSARPAWASAGVFSAEGFHGSLRSMA